MQPSKTSLFPYVLVATAGVLWGLTFSLARMATEDQGHPLGLSFWTAIGGGTMLLLFYLFRYGPQSVGVDDMKRFCIIALLGSVIPNTMYFYAVPWVPVGVLAITVALVPMLTYALSWSMRLDKFAVKRFLGIVSGLLAVALLVGPDTSLPDPTMLKWVLLALGAAVFYTVENVYVDAFVPASTDMVLLVAGALTMAGVILFPVVIAFDAFVPLTLPLGKSEWAILAIMLFSSVSYVMFFYVIRVAGAVFASLTGYMVTLCGVFWGMLLFDERHSAWVWSALILMLLGMALVRPRRRATGR